MAPCQHCTGAAFEHVTGDERILYCGRCGWEHRERLATGRPRGPKRAEHPSGRSPRAPHRASR
jgi:hypothetical protein